MMPSHLSGEQLIKSSLKLTKMILKMLLSRRKGLSQVVIKRKMISLKAHKSKSSSMLEIQEMFN
jgi:hypothetical protein